MKNKIIIAIAGLVLVGGLAMTGCACGAQKAVINESDQQTQTQEDPQEQAAADGVFGKFESVTLTGDPVTQAIFAEADLTMVNIWGTFCGPCIREMPDLAELSGEVADQGGRIIGIMSDVTQAQDATALKIVQQTGADYTHIVLDQELVDNYLNQVQVVPTTVFVDKEGKQVGDVYTGSRSKAAWAAIFEELLAQI